MTKVVIIGASAAGHTAAVALRERNKDCTIVLVTEESHPFYEKRRLLDLLAGRINESQLLCTSDEFYNQQRITFLKEKEVSAVNPEKKRIFIKDDIPIEYDLLAICSGRNFALPQIPGIKKRGVFRLYSLSDVKEFLSYLITAPVCVVGASPLAIDIAGVIASRRKEVKLVTSCAAEPSLQEGNLLGAPSEQAAGNIEVINSEITEIIGDGEVQAIRIKTGKIIGACAVIFMGRTHGNTAFLKDSTIALHKDMLYVDESLRTNLASVYACGSVCTHTQAEARIKTWDEVVREGNALADSLHLAISA